MLADFRLDSTYCMNAQEARDSSCTCIGAIRMQIREDSVQIYQTKCAEAFFDALKCQLAELEYMQLVM